MAITSNRKTTVGISGDQSFGWVAEAAANASSPNSQTIQNLTLGDNTITVPTAGTVPTSVVILPPTANATAITLKGIGADTGFRLHNTDHTVLALHATVVSFVLNAGAGITGVRFFWL